LYGVFRHVCPRPLAVAAEAFSVRVRFDQCPPCISTGRHLTQTNFSTPSDTHCRQTLSLSVAPQTKHFAVIQILLSVAAAYITVPLCGESRPKNLLQRFRHGIGRRVRRWKQDITAVKSRISDATPYQIISHKKDLKVAFTA
jgi:hypothetical protein